METLANWINRRGPLAPRDAVGWTIRLARHLESMHTHGVAHGAISPACAMIESNVPSSKGIVADVRRTVEMVQYHSPERLQNGQLSPLDDVWALAGTLFSMLTCARPFGELRPEIEARMRQGLPHLASYGVNDDQLYAIVATALFPDLSRRTNNVAMLRMQLEHWANDPSFRVLPPLDPEDSGEEDQAATAMVPMSNMFDESSTSQRSPHSSPQSGPTSSQLFAPPSFEPASQMQSQARPQPVSSSPLGEQDATVMRALPAHIIAMAQRAVSGSNPPPAPPAPEPPPPDNDDSDEDFGAATKIGEAPNLASLLNASRDPGLPPGAMPPPSRPLPPMPPPGPPMPPPPPSGRGPLPPPSAPARPQIPRAFKSTQLGMGIPNVGPAPAAPPPPPSAPGPRAGFAPPPTSISTNPPPRDPDDVRTVMHSVEHQDLLKSVTGGGLAQGPGPAGPPAFAPQHRPAFPPQPRAPQPPPPPMDGDDDDDGGRTVMREAPIEPFNPPPQAPPPPTAQQWQPAPPPASGFQPQTQTDRPAPAHPETTGPTQALGGLGVSAMIQETIQSMGGPAPGADAGPPGFPSPFEPTGGFGNAAPLLPNPNAPAGPFQPLGIGANLQGANMQGSNLQGPFSPSPASPGGGGPFTPSHGNPVFDQSLPTFDPGPNNQGGAPSGGNQPANAGGPGSGAIAPSGEAAPAPKKRSSVGLLVVCFLVLILAAASTFLALKFRAQLGF